MIKGWQKAAKGNLLTTAQDLQNLGVKRFLYTDVTKDGTLTEPNYGEITELLKATTVPIIASGGITTLEAIGKLKNTGVEAAIVGKALYEGKLSLQAANSVS